MKSPGPKEGALVLPATSAIGRRCPTTAILALTVAASLAAAGQERRPFRSGARTVAVYATVSDEAGRLVPDLTHEDFEIYDNGKEQPITLFASEVQPISVVMLLDRSGSVMTNFRLVEVAAGEFVKGLLPADKVRIGSFAGRIQLDPREFTSDRGEMLNILRTELQPAGPTPLWNAVSVAVTALRHQEGRRVILVFTDGVDYTGGGRSVGLNEALRRAQEDNVMVYAIGLATERRVSGRGRRGGIIIGPAPMRPRVEIQRPDPGLPRIAVETGGGYFELRRTSDLAATFAKVVDELHRQYALGFEPPKLDGKSHRLEVRLKRPGLNARARRAYIAARDDS
jgi:Ca-activated chloride channel family protein